MRIVTSTSFEILIFFKEFHSLNYRFSVAKLIQGGVIMILLWRSKSAKRLKNPRILMFYLQIDRSWTSISQRKTLGFFYVFDAPPCTINSLNIFHISPYLRYRYSASSSILLILVLWAKLHPVMPRISPWQ